MNDGAQQPVVAKHPRRGRFGVRQSVAGDARWLNENHIWGDSWAARTFDSEAETQSWLETRAPGEPAAGK